MPTKGSSSGPSSRSITTAQIAYQVKTAILVIYGMNRPDPDTLKPSRLMSEFNFNDYQWIELAGRLSDIVQAYRPGQTVGVREVESMVTVQDCIDLVSNLVNQKPQNP